LTEAIPILAAENTSAYAPISSQENKCVTEISEMSLGESHMDEMFSSHIDYEEYIKKDFKVISDSEVPDSRDFRPAIELQEKQISLVENKTPEKENSEYLENDKFKTQMEDRHAHEEYNYDEPISLIETNIVSKPGNLDSKECCSKTSSVTDCNYVDEKPEDCSISPETELGMSDSCSESLIPKLETINYLPNLVVVGPPAKEEEEEKESITLLESHSFEVHQNKSLEHDPSIKELQVEDLLHEESISLNENNHLINTGSHDSGECSFFGKEYLSRSDPLVKDQEEEIIRVVESHTFEKDKNKSLVDDPLNKELQDEYLQQQDRYKEPISMNETNRVSNLERSDSERWSSLGIEYSSTSGPPAKDQEEEIIMVLESLVDDPLNKELQDEYFQQQDKYEESMSMNETNRVSNPDRHDSERWSSLGKEYSSTSGPPAKDQEEEIIMMLKSHTYERDKNKSLEDYQLNKELQDEYLQQQDRYEESISLNETNCAFSPDRHDFERWSSLSKEYSSTSGPLAKDQEEEIIMMLESHTFEIDKNKSLEDDPLNKELQDEYLQQQDKYEESISMNETNHVSNPGSPDSERWSSFGKEYSSTSSLETVVDINIDQPGPPQICPETVTSHTEINTCLNQNLKNEEQEFSSNDELFVEIKSSPESLEKKGKEEIESFDTSLLGLNFGNEPEGLEAIEIDGNCDALENNKISDVEKNISNVQFIFPEEKFFSFSENIKSQKETEEALQVDQQEKPTKLSQIDDCEDFNVLENNTGGIMTDQLEDKDSPDNQVIILFLD